MFDWSTLVGLIATATFDVVYFGVVLGTILVIVLDNRNPVKTLAWILVLIFLPIDFPPSVIMGKNKKKTPQSVFCFVKNQNSALDTVRGNGKTSLMLPTPVRYITIRSKPRP